MRSLLGSVRTGEGIAWWFDVGILGAAAMILWRLKFWRKAMIFAATGSFLVCAILSGAHVHLKDFFEVGFFFAPLHFVDYLAFNLLMLFPLFYLALSRQLSGFWLWGIFYVLINIAFMFTLNKAMIAAGITAPLFFLGLWSLTKEPIRRPLSLLVIIGTPIFWVSIFAAVVLVDLEGGFYAFESSGPFRTVASRAYLMDVSFAPLLEDPARFLTGFGWGRYIDHLALYQPSAWLDFVNFSGSQWDGLSFDHFHSHNMFLDTLNAAGVFGLACLFLYFLAFVLCAKKIFKYAAILQGVGLMTWASLWFLLPVQLPFLAIGAAIIGSFKRLPYWPIRKLAPTVVLGVLLIALVVQIMAAFVTAATANRYPGYEPQSLSAAEAQEACPIEYEDYGAGGLHLSKMMLDRVRYTIDQSVPQNEKDNYEKEGPDSIAGHVRAINHFFCQAGAYINARPTSTRLEITHLIVRGEILLGLDDYIDEETRAYYYDGWQEELRAWLEEKGRRTDLATPYLLYHVMQGRDEYAAPIINVIYNQNKEDPVGLWFKGLLLLTRGSDAQEGLQLMRKALDRGIDRFVAVPEDIRLMLESVQL